MTAMSHNAKRFLEKRQTVATSSKADFNSKQLGAPSKALAPKILRTKAPPVVV
jgi:hypothetical protein